MPKILIIGPQYFNFNQSIKDVFISLGWEVHLESYDEPIHPFSGWLKWQHKFSPNREKLREKYTVKYQKYIISQFLQFNPELVLVLNGTILKSDTLTLFRKTAKVVLWMYDSVFRYPKCINHIDFVDYAFFYEQKNMTYYQALGKKAYFLPQAADVNIYHPIQTDKPKTIDILFVGVLYHYPKRIALLTKIVKNFSSQKIKIVGRYKPIEKNMFKWLFREKRHVFTNRNVMPIEVNKLYNQSKIVLNIHHETQIEGANPKVFEICVSGAYQICDYNLYIASLFPNGEVGLYKNEQELFDLIEDALQNDKSEQAEKAREIVINHHTFEVRIKEILQVISRLQF
jgi:spore maturation protein CgeB